MARNEKREERRDNVLTAWNNFHPVETHLSAEEIETWLTTLESFLVAACVDRQSVKMSAKIND